MQYRSLIPPLTDTIHSLPEEAEFCVLILRNVLFPKKNSCKQLFFLLEYVGSFSAEGSMSRFFISPDELERGSCVLTGENAAHAKVLRLRVGENVTVSDAMGRESSGTVVSVGQEYRIEFGAPVLSRSEPQCKVGLFLAYAKADKLEHVVQKATELGAASISFFPSVYCVSRPDAKGARAKVDRAKRICLSAAEQSGRGIIPEIRAFDSYQAALQAASEAERFLFLYEGERQLSLGRALADAKPKTLSLMSGPEGGFAEEEVAGAVSSGAEICTLGPRILRCETAPLCALTCALFALGEYDEY